MRESEMKLIDLIVLALIGLGLFLLVNFIGSVIPISNGYRIGEVQKVSYKGLIIKNHEGEIALEGFKWDKGTNFEFTCCCKEVADSLENKVKVYYTQYLCTNMFLYNNNYFVYKVEKLR